MSLVKKTSTLVERAELPGINIRFCGRSCSPTTKRPTGFQIKMYLSQHKSSNRYDEAVFSCCVATSPPWPEPWGLHRHQAGENSLWS